MSIDENIFQRLRNIATPTLANALDDIGFNGVMNNLHPAGLGMKIVGRAVTVQEVAGPYGSFSTEEFKVGHMIDAASPGDVIVVANNGAQVSTWGGMASYSAKLKGIAGLIVDGGVRDREEIVEFSFTTFSSTQLSLTSGKTISPNLNFLILLPIFLTLAIHSAPINDGSFGLFAYLPSTNKISAGLIGKQMTSIKTSFSFIVLILSTFFK